MWEQQFVIVILVIFSLERASADTCDLEVASVHEGLLGQSADFKWLGVLQVHIRDFDKRHVAITGIALIKARYALANANDVARIPERVLKQDTVAVFIPAEVTPFALSVLSYVVHPEYGDSTVHSLAVVELNIDEVKDFSLTPVCLSSGNIKKNKNLYLIGFTDENAGLEKVFHKIQTLDKPVCDEFNERIGITDSRTHPTYVCGYAPYSAVNCQWDDGMALVSNDTGRITLEGLSLHGPGCTAPARFIELYPYLSWIQLVTRYEGGSFATPQPQPQRRDQFEYIPVHKLFTSNETRRNDPPQPPITVLGHDFVAHVLGGKMDHYTISPIERDNYSLAIYTFDDKLEKFDNACISRRTLMYREQFYLNAQSESGEVTYKLALYDLINMACICVTMSVHCVNRTKAVIEFREEMDFVSGTEDLIDLKLEQMYKQVPIVIRTEKPKIKKKEPNWLQLDKFEPKAITMEYRKGTVLTNVLYVRIKFSGIAKLNFKMFAYPLKLYNPTTIKPELTSYYDDDDDTGSSPGGQTTEAPTTTESPGDRRYSRVREGEDFWGIHHPGRMYKEEMGSITADIMDIVSVGSRSMPTLAVLGIQCFFIIVSLRQIYL